MDREIRYQVAKIKDIQGALTEAELAIFAVLTDKVDKHRIEAGKEPLQCVVVERDWPEYDDTWLAIAIRVDKETGLSSRESRIDQYERYG